jgi:hypothetical protein
MADMILDRFEALASRKVKLSHSRLKGNLDRAIEFRG